MKKLFLALIIMCLMIGTTIAESDIILSHEEIVQKLNWWDRLMLALQPQATYAGGGNYLCDENAGVDHGTAYQVTQVTCNKPYCICMEYSSDYSQVYKNKEVSQGTICVFGRDYGTPTIYEVYGCDTATRQCGAWTPVSCGGSAGTVDCPTYEMLFKEVCTQPAETNYVCTSQPECRTQCTSNAECAADKYCESETCISRICASGERIENHLCVTESVLFPVDPTYCDNQIKTAEKSLADTQCTAWLTDSNTASCQVYKATNAEEYMACAMIKSTITSYCLNVGRTECNTRTGNCLTDETTFSTLTSCKSYIGTTPPPVKPCSNPSADLNQYKCTDAKIYKCESTGWKEDSSCPTGNSCTSSGVYGDKTNICKGTTPPPPPTCTPACVTPQVCVSGKCTTPTTTCSNPTANLTQYNCVNNKIFKCESTGWKEDSSCPIGQECSSANKAYTSKIVICKSSPSEEGGWFEKYWIVIVLGIAAVAVLFKKKSPTRARPMRVPIRVVRRR